MKFILLLGLIAVMSFGDDAKAREIMQKVHDRDDGKTLVQNMKMVLVDKGGKKRIRALKSYSKEFGADTHKAMFFLSPSDVKNTAFLTFDYDDANKDDDQWLYLPALKKVKRIPTSDKSSSFMGSDFSYFDMTDRDLEDYDFKLIKELKVKGKAAWAIEATPRNSAVVKESGYTKSIAIVRKDNYVVVRSINFLTNGKKKYFEVKKMHKQSGVWVMDMMSMTTKRGKATLHKTLLYFSDIVVNSKLDDTIFTTRNIQKGL